MRTSSRNISLNSLSPVSVRMGRTSMPGESMGMIIQVMPRCLGASGSVRTRSSQRSCACEVQIFWPVTT